MASRTKNRLAVVTGASSGIGYHLAQYAGLNGYDLILAADRPLRLASQRLGAMGISVATLEADLSQPANVDRLMEVINNRPVDALMANAGQGLGGLFLEQDFGDIQQVIHTNITGTIDLLQRVASSMVRIGHGRILITGSIVGFQPGPFHAVYNGSKAFINSFAAALRNELQHTSVTVTCLMPGATNTNAFARAGMLNTIIGSTEQLQMDAAKVAALGFKAMQDGQADVVAGLLNKVIVSASKILPAPVVAELHRQLAQPR